jgi:hypothetical protein
MKSLAICCFVLLLGAMTVDADKQQPPRFIEHVRIHFAKGGGGSIEIATNWPLEMAEAAAGKKLDPEKLDVMAEYDVANRKTKVSKSDSGIIRVVTRGELEDIFHLAKVWDSGRPFALVRNRTFEIKWDGDTLTLRMKYLGNAPPDPPDGPPLEITTDGRFSKICTGFTGDRSKLVIKAVDKELVLEIEGLADR